MDLQHFLNRSKVLRSIDQDELVAAGIKIMSAQAQYRSFMADTIGFLAWTDDATAEIIWGIVEKRAGQAGEPRSTQTWAVGDRILIEARVDALGEDGTETEGEVFYSVPGTFHRGGGATSMMGMHVMGLLEGHSNEKVTLFTRPRKV